MAEKFLGTPYLWGGKTTLGLDCSGLVQVALTGLPALPVRATATCRSTRLGVRLALSELRRGDLMFWKGHVAIVRDGDTLIHANAHPHGRRDRAGGRSDRPHQGGGQRGDQRPTARLEQFPLALNYSLVPAKAETQERNLLAPRSGPGFPLTRE